MFKRVNCRDYRRYAGLLFMSGVLWTACSAERVKTSPVPIFTHKPDPTIVKKIKDLHADSQLKSEYFLPLNSQEFDGFEYSSGANYADMKDDIQESPSLKFQVSLKSDNAVLISKIRHFDGVLRNYVSFELNGATNPKLFQKVKKLLSESHTLKSKYSFDEMFEVPGEFHSVVYFQAGVGCRKHFFPQVESAQSEGESLFVELEKHVRTRIETLLTKEEEYSDLLMPAIEQSELDRAIRVLENELKPTAQALSVNSGESSQTVDGKSNPIVQAQPANPVPVIQGVDKKSEGEKQSPNPEKDSPVQDVKKNDSIKTGSFDRFVYKGRRKVIGADRAPVWSDILFDVAYLPEKDLIRISNISLQEQGTKTILSFEVQEKSRSELYNQLKPLFVPGMVVVSKIESKKIPKQKPKGQTNFVSYYIDDFHFRDLLNPQVILGNDRQDKIFDLMEDAVREHLKSESKDKDKYKNKDKDK